MSSVRLLAPSAGRKTWRCGLIINPVGRVTGPPGLSEAEEPFGVREALCYGALCLLSALSACSTRDDFPMRNEAGGQVMCHSGYYSFEEGLPQARIAMQCIAACEMYGYRRFTGNPHADTPHPGKPDSDVVPEIPRECLPER